MTDGISRQAARADRPVRRYKPVWRGILHLIWFPLSLIAGAVLIVVARETASAVVYACSVSAMFGTSAAYHRVDWRSGVRRILQRIDHLMIFVLIAGTVTPMYLLALPGRSGRLCLILTWAFAIAAAGLHVSRMEAPQRVAGGAYIALAAVAVPAFPLVWIHAGPIAGVFTVAGALLYVAGALAYHYGKPNPLPSVFGYHEVFHAFVCAGATCQYAAVFILVTQPG